MKRIFIRDIDFLLLSRYIVTLVLVSLYTSNILDLRSTSMEIEYPDGSSNPLSTKFSDY